MHDSAQEVIVRPLPSDREEAEHIARAKNLNEINSLWQYFIDRNWRVYALKSIARQLINTTLDESGVRVDFVTGLTHGEPRRVPGGEVYERILNTQVFLSSGHAEMIAFLRNRIPLRERINNLPDVNVDELLSILRFEEGRIVESEMGEGSFVALRPYDWEIAGIVRL